MPKCCWKILISEEKLQTLRAIFSILTFAYGTVMLLWVVMLVLAALQMVLDKMARRVLRYFINDTYYFPMKITNIVEKIYGVLRRVLHNVIATNLLYSRQIYDANQKHMGSTYNYYKHSM